MSDSCTIGFAPHLLPFQRRRIFSELLATLSREAQARGASILAIKSLGGQAEQLGRLVRQRTRWFQGHITCSARIPEMWRSNQMPGR